jgi:hypothetical protein
MIHCYFGVNRVILIFIMLLWWSPHYLDDRHAILPLHSFTAQLMSRARAVLNSGTNKAGWQTPQQSNTCACSVEICRITNRETHSYDGHHCRGFCTVEVWADQQVARTADWQRACHGLQNTAITALYGINPIHLSKGGARFRCRANLVSTHYLDKRFWIGNYFPELRNVTTHNF